jgi:tRNA-Thr(GGU) m(6)t(6)A37 methyltransferase TsaA
MTESEGYCARPIGVVESSLKDPSRAPHQDDERAPSAVLVIGEEFADGAQDIRPGEEILVLTWFHLADRDVLRVHPQGDARKPPKGVFSTRSPARPNPIGLHTVRVAGIEGRGRIRVNPCDAVDGTPILDLKPVLIKRPRAMPEESQPLGVMGPEE